MARVVKLLGYVVLVAVCALLVTEVTLRVQQRFFADPYEVYATQYQSRVLAHLHKQWIVRPGTYNPLLPPLKVFSNSKYTDQKHLESLASQARLPANGTWEGYDFIQLENSSSTTAYIAHTNNLGFRGTKNYSATKPANTYRIIVLGSYQAFGLGVEDDETYPAQLEKILSKQHPDKKIEVWNAGRPAGTAVLALAQLEELFAYEPDMIILDYGFIDHLIVGDDFFPLVLQLPNSWVGKFVGATVGPALGALDHSVVWQKWIAKFSKFREAKRVEYADVLRQIIARAQEKNVSVTLVQQMVAPLLSPSQYEALAGPYGTYVNVPEVFSNNPPAYPDPAEWKNGFWATTWLQELDPQYTRYDTGLSHIYFYPYRLDIYQLNSLGLRVLAEGIAEKIQPALLK